VSRQTPISTDVALVADVLRNGGVAAIPTETVYGLAACVNQPQAIRRVFDIKKRPYDHPLIIHLAPTADVSLWGVFNNEAQSLAATCWPGPLTLLVPRTERVPNEITGGRESVAIRVPSHPMAQQLLTLLGDGVVAPSANTFGHVSPTCAQHVQDDIGNDIDIILDGGPCSIGLESTIVDCTTSPPQIARPGKISAHDIETILSVPLAALTGPSRAPGMLASHYAPRIPVLLVESLREGRDLLTRYQRKYHHYTLIHHDDLASYAAHLYGDLRHAERQDYDGIIAVLPPAEGIGVAIRDRLRKAAAPKSEP
jgi:L-threonylcarbamoyladenylate synthase